MQGVDLNPLRVADASDRERLLSYMGPDQADRLARTAAAVALASEDPPQIAAGNAAEWIEIRLRTPQPDGTIRVATHTIEVQYFPPETQARLDEALAQAGQDASVTAPLARLGFELPAESERPELRLTLWPGRQSRRLAAAHSKSITRLDGAGTDDPRD